MDNNTIKLIEEAVIASPIIELVEGYKDYDEFMEEKYNSEEYHEAIENTIRWAIDYVNEKK